MSTVAKKRKLFSLEDTLSICALKSTSERHRKMGRYIKLQTGIKKLYVEDRQFLKQKNCIAILERHTERELISGIHEGIGQSKHSKVLSLYYRRDSSYEKIVKQFLWYSIYNDVLDHCRDFEVSQKQEDLKLKSKSQFYNVPAPTIVMKQIGMGLDNLPEVDDYRHLVGINCFGKRPQKNFRKY